MGIHSTHSRRIALLTIAALAVLAMSHAGCSGRSEKTGGYKVTLRTQPAPATTGPVHLIFTVRDGGGKPARGKAVDVVAKLPPRPPLPEMEITKPASEEGPGRYGVMVNLAARGAWSIGATVREQSAVLTEQTFVVRVH